MHPNKTPTQRGRNAQDGSTSGGKKPHQTSPATMGICQDPRMCVVCDWHSRGLEGRVWRRRASDTCVFAPTSSSMVLMHDPRRSLPISYIYLVYFTSWNVVGGFNKNNMLLSRVVAIWWNAPA